MIGGLILGILLDLDLALSGVVKFSSVVLTILPPALLVIGLLLGLWAPIGRSTTPTTPPLPLEPATVPASPPPEPIGPEAAAAEPPPNTEDTPPI